MIVVKLIGGLGNQMFQYALGRHLALRHRTELKLDASFLLDRTPREHFVYRDYDLSVFGIDNILASRQDLESLPSFKHPFLFNHLLKYLPIWRRHLCKETSFRYDTGVLDTPDHSYLDGYWQNELYFRDIEEIIRRDFTVREAADPDLSGRISGCQAVCLNVRRGDFVDNPNSRRRHGFVGLEYYTRAVQFITGKVPDPVFFIFSDDMDWCEAHLQLPTPAYHDTYRYAGNKFGTYLKLMSLCKHFIIPNSTFAWWAAWLCDYPEKIIVAPKTWLQDPVLNNEIQGIIPSRWMRI